MHDIPPSLGMRIGSLFSGIGLLELGLEQAGLGETVWQVEKEKFPLAVLEKWWPNAKRFTDVKTVGAAELDRVDLICGGFPCQDLSGAGKGAGLAGARSGLWREFARLVGELQPSWVVVENVASGADKWINAIVQDLEKLGYAALPLPITASACGAPHERARVFVVAHALGRELRIEPGRSGGSNGNSETIAGESTALDADADHKRQRQSQGREPNERRWSADRSEESSDALRAGFKGTEPRQFGRWRQLEPHDGWASESGLVPLVSRSPTRLAGRGRRARVRALGNSVVPQCAETVGYVIRELLGQ